jgi:hypothetical protein
MDIKLNLVKGQFAQIHSKGPEFSFISKNGEQCHSPHTCKDFLNDAIWAQFNNKPISIYGFKHDPSEYPHVDLEKLRIVFFNKDDKEFSSRAEGILDMVTQASAKLGFQEVPELIPLGKHDKYTDVFYITADANWLNATPLISLFTLLMRCGGVHKPGVDFMSTIKGIMDGQIKPYISADRDYIKSSINGIEMIFEEGASIFGSMSENYSPDIDKYTLHNNGIVSFANGTYSKLFPHWPTVKTK